MKYTFTDDGSKRIYGGQLSRGTMKSAGLDLRAVEFHSDGKIGTGIKVAIPYGMVGFVVVRSSLGFKHGYALANGTGVIDADYRGEIFVRLAKMNTIGRFSYNGLPDQLKAHEIKMPSLLLNQGERFAQLIILPCSHYATYVSSLDETSRGEGGIGSTGKK